MVILDSIILCDNGWEHLALIVPNASGVFDVLLGYGYYVYNSWLINLEKGTPTSVVGLVVVVVGC